MSLGHDTSARLWSFVALVDADGARSADHLPNASQIVDRSPIAMIAFRTDL